MIAYFLGGGAGGLPLGCIWYGVNMDFWRLFEEGIVCFALIFKLNLLCSVFFGIFLLAKKTLYYSGPFKQWV